MKAIIFKNEKKAKVYEVRASKSFHIYSAGELIRIVKTDNINELISDFSEGQVIVNEVK